MHPRALYAWYALAQAAQRTLAERAEVQLEDHAGSEISVGDGATFDWKEPNVDEEKGGYAA